MELEESPGPLREGPKVTVAAGVSFGEEPLILSVGRHLYGARNLGSNGRDPLGKGISGAGSEVFVVPDGLSLLEVLADYPEILGALRRVACRRIICGCHLNEELRRPWCGGRRPVTNQGRNLGEPGPRTRIC